MPAKKRGAKKPVHLPKIATRKRRSSPRRNPEDGPSKFFTKMADMGIVQALGGYAGTRLAGRIARRMLQNKFPNATRHLTPLGNLLAVIAIYFLVKKTRYVREEAMLGSVVGLVQSVLQAYLPGLATILLDTDATTMLPGPQAQAGLGAIGKGYQRNGYQRNGYQRNGRSRFVIPGEIEAARAEAARAAHMPPTTPRYVAPGSHEAGYGSGGSGGAAYDEFEEATAGVAGGGDGLDDFADDDLGIFNR